MVRSDARWPEWWEWELDCTNNHLGKRMRERSVSEIELRAMLDMATSFRPAKLSGRWIIETTNASERWNIVVEPDEQRQTLIVVTAYPKT